MKYHDFSTTTVMSIHHDFLQEIMADEVDTRYNVMPLGINISANGVVNRIRRKVTQGRKIYRVIGHPRAIDRSSGTRMTVGSTS